jgi:hypothetical protein
MKTLIIALLAALTAVAFIACGDDDDEDITTPTPTAAPTGQPSASPSPTIAAETPSPEPFEGGRDPVEREDPQVPPVALLMSVVTEAHDGFDSIIFTFSDNMPGYRIEYVEPPIVADPSDMEVEIDGEAFLRVRFTSSQAHDEAGNPTMDEREFFPGLDSIVELEQTGDFEGYVTWVAGLSAEADFRVIDDEGTLTVTVDIAHP